MPIAESISYLFNPSQRQEPLKPEDSVPRGEDPTNYSGILAPYLRVYSRLIFPISLTLLGFFFLRANEGWNMMTTAYVIVQIVTTIGYGDVVVEHESSMLFMTFFSIGMLVTVAVNLDLLVQKLYHVQTKALMGYLEEVEYKLEHMQDEIPAQHDPNEPHHHYHAALNKLLSALFSASCLAIFGVLFYGTYERCSCSTDVTRIEGCIATTYQECKATGGVLKSWVSTMYMVVMTFTTIGFGDFSPESKPGRAIGLVWMLLSVASTANLISAINGYATERRTLEAIAKKDIGAEGKEVFDLIDRDGDGKLTRAEFTAYTLIKYGLVTEEVMDVIEKEYDRLDSEQTGQVTWDMITESTSKRAKKRAQRRTTIT